MRYKRIVVEGNIGAGKTSLVNKLSEEFKGLPILETFSDNPFLPLFYEHPKRYALQLELFFMAERFQQLRDVYGQPDLFHDFVISDYMFHKSLVFARVTLPEAEFDLCQRIFMMMNVQIPQPELIVYLHCSLDRLVHNISLRGRSYETAIGKDYLAKVQDTYMNYFRQVRELPVLILDTGTKDFVNDDSAYAEVKAAINAEHKPGITHWEL